MASAAVPRGLASFARLFPASAFERIRQAHVGVVGLGGVGSWAAEALARSGVGQLTLVDADHVAQGNLNRQVQALQSTLGQAKVQALGARLAEAQPGLRLHLIEDFLSPDNVGEILPSADFWIDACDDFQAKLAMALFWKSRERPKRLVVSGGAGGKTDPGKVQQDDLSRTAQDPLLAKLRQTLRQDFQHPRSGSMLLPVVYSCENPRALPEGGDCDPSARLACAGYGSSVIVTATMGLMAADRALRVVGEVPGPKRN